MAEDETVRLYLVREVQHEAGWLSRDFKRVLFTKAEGEWSHRVANADWLPRGRMLPWRDKALEAAKHRLLDSLDGTAYFEEPDDRLPK